MKKLTKAIIPVAGLGTRMLPSTKAIPKELLPLYDRPIIEHVVKEAISAGITEIIFITRSGKEAIENKDTENYGIFDTNAEYPKPFSSIGIKKLVEKPSLVNSPSNLAVLGRYILPADIMNILENTLEGVGGEIQLTDALDKFLNYGELNAFLSTAKIFDCGNKKGFLGANLMFGMRDPKISDYLKDLFDTFNKNI
ncbi:MAG: sugar phosphate nucleotidyltransferase [Flammeovirgaceae bacterium]